MQATPLLDKAGRRRSPATTASFHEGRVPSNKGVRYPPDPPTVAEIVAVMRAAGDSPEGLRLRGIVAVLWRAGLRISEALALNETDLDPSRGSLVVRHGKGDKRREVGMDRWAWMHLDPWLRASPSAAGRPACSASCAARPADGHARQLESALNCTTPPRPPGSGVGSRHTSSGMRMRWRCRAKGSSLLVIQRQLGHADLAITSRYLRGIDNTEIIAAVHERPAP